MHPIERLRHVARVEGAGPTLVAREAAAALASFGNDPTALVTACRRLVERHVAAGTMWWVAARVLAASDPVGEAWRAAEELEDDHTPAALLRVLPAEGTIVTLGWPEQAGDALRRAGEVELLVVDAGGNWTGIVDRLARRGVDAIDVPEGAVGPAVAMADLVVLEASALGPGGFVADIGSRAAAAVARHAGIPIWLVAGAGRVLPGRLWEALVTMLEADDDPWLAADEVVPLDRVDQVIGPTGPTSMENALKRADCPIPPELLRLPHEPP
jgi:translation initiation factor 2B subunit (eIF-2B alpha/beta/delta family)